MDSEHNRAKSLHFCHWCNHHVSLWQLYNMLIESLLTVISH